MNRQTVRVSVRGPAWGVLATCMLAGCSSYAPVSLEMPLNRLESPEPMPGPVRLVSAVSKENYLILTRDQRDTVPDPVHPDIGNNPDLSPFQAGFLRGDVRLLPRLELGLRKSSDELLMGQAKLLIAGAPVGHAAPGQTSAALTVGYGRDQTSFDDHDGSGRYRTELDRDVIDVGTIVGLRTARWLLLYGGAYYNEHRYDGEQRIEPNGGGETRTALDGEAQVRGLNLGLDFNFGTPWAGGMVECARARIDAGAEREYRSSCSFGIKVQLGVDRPS